MTLRSILICKNLNLVDSYFHWQKKLQCPGLGQLTILKWSYPYKLNLFKIWRWLTLFASEVIQKNVVIILIRKEHKVIFNISMFSREIKNILFSRSKYTKSDIFSQHYNTKLLISMALIYAIKNDTLPNRLRISLLEKAYIEAGPKLSQRPYIFF